MQLKTALAQAVALLEKGGVASPRLTAEVLLIHAAHCDRAHLYAHGERELTEVEWIHYGLYLRERLDGKPTQYITGHQEFWGLDFLVNPSVLIPRPETELVVEVALALARNHFPPGTELNIADVGTGSGCIAVALATELPHARIYALDQSSQALETARRNATRLGVEHRIVFLESDLLEHFHCSDRMHISPVGALDSSPGREPWVSGRETTTSPGGAKEINPSVTQHVNHEKGLDTSSGTPLPPLQMVVSNPPYVSERDRTKLMREVRDFEPAQALFAGESGSDVYARLIPQAARALVPGGFLVLELGYDAQEQVARLLSSPAGEKEWENIEWRRDLAGIVRVVSARRRQS